MLKNLKCFTTNYKMKLIKILSHFQVWLSENNIERSCSSVFVTDIADRYLKETKQIEPIEWLHNNLINKSEIARQIGISVILFRMKLKNINRNRFTSDELKKLDDVRTKLYNSL